MLPLPDEVFIRQAMLEPDPDQEGTADGVALNPILARLNLGSLRLKTAIYDIAKDYAKTVFHACWTCYP